MSIEIWKPVVGREGEYEVSNFGRVRGLDRTMPCKCWDKYAKRVIRTAIQSGGWGIHAKLGRQYGVSESTIRQIKNGKSWRHT